MLKSVIRRILLNSAIFGLLIQIIIAAPTTYKITQIDRYRIALESGENIGLLGIDMRNLYSSKKPASQFIREVDQFLSGIKAFRIQIEYDPALPPDKSKPHVPTLAYVYYLLPADSKDIQKYQSPAGKAVLMVEGVETIEGQTKAKTKPYLRVNLNQELIRRGYARADSSKPFHYQKVFLLAEKEAEIDKAGIWE